MTPTDFRALCAELVHGWDDLSLHDAGALETFVEDVRTELSAAPQQPSDEKLRQLWRLGWMSRNPEDGAVLFAREVLDRYGSPAPVPVAERLPGPRDCDAEGRCWWYMAAHASGIFRQSSSWCLGKRVPEDFGIWTHWLPYWALPLPEAQP